MLWYLLTVIGLLGLSALFSGSETAFFSLNQGRRELLRSTHPSASRRIEKLLADSGQPLLATLLCANLSVNTAASAVFTLVSLEFCRRTGLNTTLGLTAAGIVMTALLLVFGEVTPKLLASRIPVGFARFTAPVLIPLHRLLGPLASVFKAVTSRVAFLQRDPDVLSDAELHTMIQVGRERGTLAAGEEEILSRLIGLENRTVSEVMTPRIDIAGIEERASIREAVSVARASGFSRLPLYAGSLDRILGIVYVKDLLTAPDPAAPALTVARPPFFVPEVKRLLELLDELRRKGSHIAVVVDEFGQTAGIVTLEDLLEAIFGEITDEQDIAEELPYFRHDADSYLVDGEIDIASLNRLFDQAFPRESRRLSAFIAGRLGRLPAKGDKIRCGDLMITVHETDGNKLEKVLIHRLRPPQGQATHGQP